MCKTKIIMLIIVIITCFIAISYIFNMRIENMKVKYHCPQSLQKTNEGLFKVSFPHNKSPPKIYHNLEEYTKLINWQHKNDIKCPILELQSSSETLTPMELSEGEEKIQLLVDAGREDSIYNVDSYPGFDSHNQYIGVKTPLDLMENMEENKEVSANAMDSNWGGNEYTKQLVDSGFYDDNSI